MDNFVLNEKREQKKQTLLIILCWLVYVVSYAGRYSYSSNLTLIMKDYDVTRAAAGLSVTLFSLAYGAGQIVNGMFCKRYNKRVVLSIALLVSSITNVCCFFDIPFTYIKYLWFINGAAQSFLWSSLICILSQNMDEKHLKTSIMAMGTTTAIGTLICYGLSALFSFLGNYKLSFLTGAVFTLCVSVLFFIAFPKLTSVKQFVSIENETKKQAEPSTGNSSSAVLVSVSLFVVTLCVLSVFNNFVKDGLNTWMPTILKENYGLSDGLSIVFTLALPFASVFATMFTMFLNKRIKDFAALCGIMFCGAAVCIFIVLLLIGKGHWIFVVIPFGIVALMMSGINCTITTFVPLLLRDKMDSGKATGLFDGFCYLGSALSGVGLGLITDLFDGWTVPLAVLCALSVLAILISLGYLLITKKMQSKNAK